MSLTVGFLTRDEERNIARAIQSVLPVADQIIVADTASKDRTSQIAQQLGVEVEQFPWHDDFAAGRNFVVEKARGDWVLWMNADEELLNPDPEVFQECFRRPGAFGFFVGVRFVNDQGAFTETQDVRLFHRRPDLRFIGRLHPRFDAPLMAQLEHERLQVFPSPITLRSHADTSRPTESKLRWIERLLRLELADRPGQLHYLIEHGRTLLMLGEESGHDLMAKAAEQVWPVRGEPMAPSWKVQVLLEYLLSIPPEQNRSKLGRDEARALSLRWFPSSPPLLWLNAGHFYAQGQFAQAAELLERLVELGRTSTYDKSIRFDPKIIGDQALMNLGACHLQLGEFDSAERCFRQLLNSPTLGPDAARNLSAVEFHRASQRNTPSGSPRNGN